ncbi:MAG: hypothetical protein V2A79_07730 [Planctomycetota bacterium]
MRRLSIMVLVLLVLMVPGLQAAEIGQPQDETTLPQSVAPASPQVDSGARAALECDGRGWPTEYVPVEAVVELPSARLGLRGALEFVENRLPPLDVEALLAEDASKQGSGDPVRAGVSRALEEPVQGEWHETVDGERLWTTAIVAEGALELRLHFVEANLPPGAEVYVYSPEDPQGTIGPYTGMGPLQRGEFWAASTKGQTAYVEYYTPDRDAMEVPFRIDQLAHMYLLADEPGGSRAPLDCMGDVACYSAWEDVSYAVARIYMYSDGSWGFCTGTLLATTSGDLTPYFLTSAHCLDQQAEADTIQFRWFYQHATCGGALMSSQYSNYADVLSTSGGGSGADWTLLMVKGVLPAGVFWSGWTNGSIAAGTWSVTVHHPDASWKRYSRGQRQSYSTYYDKIIFNVSGAVGTIYFGTSGSGIWRESDQKLFGNASWVSSGDAGCDFLSTFAGYGRFSTYYSTIASFLATGSDDTLEDNDTCATAAAVGSGSYPNLVVKSVDDDWYQIGVGAGVTLNVNLTFVDNNGNIDARLYDSCGGTQVASSLSTDDNEQIVYYNSGASGSFFLRVYLADDTRNAYSITISGGFLDCNGNGIPDSVDISGGTSLDCNGNSTPDECEAQTDCQPNGVLDICDIAGSTSLDCQPNGIPDECETAVLDCNGNLVPDDCDIAGATSQDCQPDGVPDECQLSGNDCNANSTPDDCEPDCNTNGVADACDITAGTSHDCNTNGRPDECDVTRCYSVWDGFQPNPPFSYGRPLSQIDYDADGVYWNNPQGTATISPIGCEIQDLNDMAVHVTVPGAGDPQDGYVSSEYFHTVEGALPADEKIYTLYFRPKLENSLNPKTDWQFFIYDGLTAKQVIQIQFASTVSTLVGTTNRGYVVVKNPAGGFLSTGVRPSLYTCYQFKVVLNNLDGSVQLYIDDMVTAKVTTTPLESAARRMDYFRLQAVSNGASSGGTTVMSLDHFELCLMGSAVPPELFPDCNGNTILDECDIAAGTSTDCNGNGVPDECGWLDLGDFNGDGDVDLIDYEIFESCITGPCVSPPCDPPLYVGFPGPCCGIGDSDKDGAIDLSDFAGFQDVFTGSP